MYSSNVSLADIAAVTGRNNGGFGDGEGWWVLIILFALFGGWGNGGYGNQGSGVGAEVQRGFDTSAIITKLDGINNGICSLGYDQLAQMNGINQNIMQTGFGLQGALNSLSAQLAQCCCENREAIAQVRYDMATDACAVTTAIKDAACSINQNTDANFRAIYQEIVADRMAAKDAKIAEQASLINALNLAQSQANQNQYLIDQLRPAPVPAFLTCNPYAYTQAGYGYTGGCGCGFNN